MAPDFIERLKASAQHQLYLYRSYHLPIARSESINADSQTPTSYSSEEGLVAGHSRQFTPGGYLSNCETHCVSADRTHNLPIVSPTRLSVVLPRPIYILPINAHGM